MLFVVVPKVLQALGLPSSCGSWAVDHRGSVVAAGKFSSFACGLSCSMAWDRTHVPWIARHILNHWTTWESPHPLFSLCSSLDFFGFFACIPSVNVCFLYTSLTFQYFGHLMRRVDSLKRLWCWEGLGAGGEGDDRGWDGWMVSPTWWTWVWVNSGSWWWTGRPGVLQFMGSQRVRHDWASELNFPDFTPVFSNSFFFIAAYSCFVKVMFSQKLLACFVFNAPLLFELLPFHPQISDEEWEIWSR